MTSFTNDFSKNIYRSLLYYPLCLALLFTSAIGVFAQNVTTTQLSEDHLFAEKGKSIITAATGIPYIGIAEYAYGVSDRFTIGVLIGSTPIIPGYGIRLRNVLYSNGSDKRIYLRTPLLYYPQTKGLGGEPWLLTWPAVNFEKRTNSGLRWSYGVGVVAAACVNDLLDLVGIGEHVHDLLNEETLNHTQLTHDVHDHHGPLRATDDHHDTTVSGHDEEGFMGGVWNTVQVGLALPIGKSWMFQSEIGLVMKGVKIATEDWVGGPPVILTLGVTHSF